MTIISQIKTLGLSNLIKLKKLSLIKNKSINHKYLTKTGKNKNQIKFQEMQQQKRMAKDKETQRPNTNSLKGRTKLCMNI